MEQRTPQTSRGVGQGDRDAACRAPLPPFSSETQNAGDSHTPPPQRHSHQSSLLPKPVQGCGRKSRGLEGARPRPGLWFCGIRWSEQPQQLRIRKALGKASTVSTHTLGRLVLDGSRTPQWPFRASRVPLPTAQVLAGDGVDSPSLPLPTSPPPSLASVPFTPRLNLSKREGGGEHGRVWLGSPCSLSWAGSDTLPAGICGPGRSLSLGTALQCTLEADHT